MRADITYEPIVAYRTWRLLKPHYLSDLGNRVIWLPGVKMEAECLSGRFAAHEVTPADGCTCGIYAARSADGLQQLGYGSEVCGEVYLWGRVIEHEHGFKAQYAYPKSLKIISPNDETVLAMKLALAYGVECTVEKPKPRPVVECAPTQPAPRRRKRASGATLLKRADDMIYHARSAIVYWEQKLGEARRYRTQVLARRGEGVTQL